MPWFAAHAILYFKYTDGPQDSFFFHENVLLIEAPDAPQALSQAEARARLDEGDSSGSLRVDGRPSTLVFGGIRKLISVDWDGPGDRIGDGAELTYSYFEAADREALDRVIRGEEAAVRYLE
jgi:hypothetical protein